MWRRNPILEALIKNWIRRAYSKSNQTPFNPKKKKGAQFRGVKPIRGPFPKTRANDFGGVLKKGVPPLKRKTHKKRGFSQKGRKKPGHPKNPEGGALGKKRTPLWGARKTPF